MGYLILMSEKYLLENILEKVCGMEIFFPLRKSNWIHVLRNVYHKDLKQNLKGLNNFVCIKVYNFRKSVNFKASQESTLIKI